MQVYIKTIADLSNSSILEINGLTERTWPETKKPALTEQVQVKNFQDRNPNKHCHLIYKEKQLIAYAESFPRLVKHAGKEITLMGLGAVCVDHSARGLGLGAKIVERCLNRVDEGEFEVSLFQTMVPNFYKKLGCQVIENQIINSLNIESPTTNPFWDDFIISYPTDYQWTNEKIDLLGTGY